MAAISAGSVLFDAKDARRMKRFPVKSTLLVCLICLSTVAFYEYSGAFSYHSMQISRNNADQPKITDRAIKIQSSSTPENVNIPPDSRIMYDSLSVTNSFNFNNMTTERIAYIYHSIVDAIEVPCRRKIRLGSSDDGGYEICDDEEWRPKKPCLIYSFGINNDFSFDDMLGKVYGCEIHSFDPSMKVMSHRRSRFVFFHKIGLFGSRQRTTAGWELYDFNSVKEMLGHQNRTIDILKVDIEESEWSFLGNALTSKALTNVKQFVIELHLLTKDTREQYLKRLKHLVSLRKAGFRSYFVHKNRWTPMKNPTWFRNNGTVPCCYEVHMFNMAFNNK